MLCLKQDVCLNRVYIHNAVFCHSPGAICSDVIVFCLGLYSLQKDAFVDELKCPYPWHKPTGLSARHAVCSTETWWLATGHVAVCLRRPRLCGVIPKHDAVFQIITPISSRWLLSERNICKHSFSFSLSVGWKRESASKSGWLCGCKCPRLWVMCEPELPRLVSGKIVCFYWAYLYTTPEHSDLCVLALRAQGPFYIINLTSRILPFDFHLKKMSSCFKEHW